MIGRGARGSGRRTHRIPVPFTYQELADARQRAHNAGRPLARYIREAALGGNPRPLRLQHHEDVVHLLSTIVLQLDDAAGHAAVPAIMRVQDALRALPLASHHVIAQSSSGRAFGGLVRYLLHGRSGEEHSRARAPTVAHQRRQTHH